MSQSGRYTQRDTVGSVDPRTAVSTYLEIADSVAPGLVEGLYVVGSVALDDWVEGCSDIDIVAVTAEPATDDDVGYLRTIHALVAERDDMPSIDGPYVAWGDLMIEPATGLHRPWALDGRVHHDGDCFEINPVTWYTLAHYGVLVRGPSIANLEIPTDVEARVRFVVDNLRTYWTNVADEVQHTCDVTPEATFAASSLVWCALGALRLHYTAFTADVTSKRGAGGYGLIVAPEQFHTTLSTAIDLRAAAEQGAADTAAMLDAAAIIRWVIDEVEAASS